VRYDLPASFVVFLIAIPLSLGIAAASGAPLMAGIIAAVVGGVVAGSLGGAPLQVSGPAAGLTVIVSELVLQHGWAATAAMGALAGLVQIVLGLTRVGRAALSLSPAVVHGMLAGIGIVIVLSQVHVVLGGAPQSSVWKNLRELPAQLVGHHDAAVIVGVMTIAVLLIWPRLVKVSYLPAPLVAVVVATAVALGLELPRVSLPDNPITGLVLPRWPEASLGVIVTGVLTIAVVASVESLLSAVAVDKLHTGPRANLDRELLAQGVANSTSGLLGGLPVTGVIVRSSANVAAGARTRASTVLHGVWVALFVLLLTGLLKLIPMAALAAVLVVVGLRLVSIAHVRTFMRHRELPVYATTVAGVVLLDLVMGVLLGLAVALLSALYRLTHWRIQLEERETGRWLVRITGTLLFLGVGRLTHELRRLPPSQHVDMELHLDFLDHAAFEAIEDWRTGYERLGGQVSIQERHDIWFDHAVQDRLGVRKSLPAPLPRWFAPWSHWQADAAAVHGGSGPTQRADPALTPSDRTPEQDREAAPSGEHPLSGSTRAMFAGLHEFQRRVAPLVRPFLIDLARHGQRPQQLFITCADSRMVPNLITTSGPGDLFCVRNLGNIVPRYGAAGDHSVGAAIEYAVDVLGVSTITVCGHSDCGAMHALLDGTLEKDSYLASWLRHAEPSLGHEETQASRWDDLPLVERQCLVNITQQVDNLLTYPSVRRHLDTGHLRLVGMYFDLHEARMYLVDAKLGTRQPVPNLATL
jgi:carbonic anhydrase